MEAKVLDIEADVPDIEASVVFREATLREHLLPISSRAAEGKPRDEPPPFWVTSKGVLRPSYALRLRRRSFGGSG